MEIDFLLVAPFPDAAMKVVGGHADYRLVSRQAIQELEGLPKAAIFLRGDFPRLGLESTTVEYYRRQRQAGRSKYSLGKMLGLALDGFKSSGTREEAKATGAVSFVVVNRTERAGA